MSLVAEAETAVNGNLLAAKLIGAALILAAAFGAGWAVNGWRLKTDLAELKASRAEEITQASQVALSDYQAAAKTIHDAAASAQLDLSGINTKLATIRRNQKNVPTTPLPPDCKPGPVRLHNLAETAAAADQAIARPVPSR